MVFNFLKKQFIDVIECDWQDDNMLMWKFPMADNEIQSGAMLTVRDGQVAIFVNEGQVADVFTPGLHKLTTQTLPLLTNLQNWDKMFASPFKSDVLFFNTRLQQGRKWGTAQPVTVRDSEFGMVRIRAFGMYGYKLTDVTKFYKEIAGSNSDYTTDQIEPQLRNLINANLAGSLGNSQASFVDLASNQALMGDEIKQTLAEHFATYGFTIETMIVENVSLPDELQKILDKRMAMGMIGDMNKYTQYQSAEAITMAAQNEGGLAGMGAGLGVGMQMGQVMETAMMGSMQQQQPMQQQMQQQPMQQMQQPPQAPAAAPMDFAAKLAQLQTLLEQGLITQADYDEAKSKVIASLTN